jgi:RNA polymerase sigma factor for flagellar operon FliA
MEAAISRQERRDALISEYQEYVHYVVGYLVQSMRLPADLFDEFVAAGYLGLVEAAERFDFEAGKPFKNFAFLRIRGAIIDSIRECSELSGRAYHYARALKAALDLREQLAQELESAAVDSPPAEDEAGAALEYAAKSLMAFRLSLAQCKNELTTNGRYGENPEVQLSKKEIAKKFRTLLATLPEKERLVIEEYYFNDKSFVEIASEHEGFSKSWVSRLHSRALSRLEHRVMAARLR